MIGIRLERRTAIEHFPPKRSHNEFSYYQLYIEYNNLHKLNGNKAIGKLQKWMHVI